MQNILQCFPKWAKIKIGNSNKTICSDGCLISSLSFLSQWYGDYKSPEWMAKNLLFTQDGSLIWQSLNEDLPFKFVYRYYSKDDSKIKGILNSKDNACVLRINYKGYVHWVALIGYSRLNGYKIMNPLTGTEWLKYEITGFAEITRS